MFATIKKTLVAGAVLAVTAASAQALTVKFDQPSMGFGKGPIVVEAPNGKTWSKINSTNLTLPYSLFIQSNGNEYDSARYQVLQRNTPIYQSLEFFAEDVPNPYLDGDVGTGSTNNFDTISKMNLLDACNKRLEKQGAINEDQHLYFNVPVTAVVQFRNKRGPNFNRTAYGHSKVPVICKGVPKRVPTEPIKISKVRFQVYAEADKRCPRYRYVRLRLEGDRTGFANVIVMRDDGKKIERKVPITRPGEHQFFSLESTRVTKSETRKYYLVVKGHKISVGWKTVAIKCSIAEDDNPDEVTSDQRPNLGKPKPGKIVGKRPSVPTALVNPIKPKRPTTRVGGLKTPPLVCIGGKVKLNNCYCKPTYKKLKIGAHAYRCIRVVTNKTLKRAKPARKQQVSTPAQQQNRPLLKLLKKKR